MPLMDFAFVRREKLEGKEGTEWAANGGCVV
ncbi:MAG: hypothetical protein OGMRLDGQ_001100 [Candidatus Fervidibacter sp.]|jgi:hypothetical protein